MISKEMSKEVVKAIATADRIEKLLFSAALGAILESDGRFEAGYVDKLKAEYSPEEFNKALEKNRDLIADTQRNGDTKIYDTCRKVEAFILRHLTGANNGRWI